jgi:hypothetical protein
MWALLPRSTVRRLASIRRGQSSEHFCAVEGQRRVCMSKTENRRDGLTGSQAPPRIPQLPNCRECPISATPIPIGN